MENIYHGIFFFFKQKTAYGLLGSLVGSEMCIRDRETSVHENSQPVARQDNVRLAGKIRPSQSESIAQAMEQLSNGYLGLRVTAADRLHVAAALRRNDRIFFVHSRI